MINAELNERLTRTGPGTPAGEVLRRYWQPAALTEEFEGPRPVKAVKLLGQDLVLFRTPDGHYSLFNRYCPHRGADLSYGRLESESLRCPFHGWLFDRNGQCLEQPAEPAGSRFHTRIKQQAYPCVEKNGIIFTYMGPGEPPPLPGLDCLMAPAEQVFSFKGFWACNWLQAQEVGIDPAHASFLHRFLEDEDVNESYGKQFRGQAADSRMALTRVLREHDRPTINVEDTDYGFRLITLRELDESNIHVRVTNLLFPNAIAIPMNNDMIITQWHVPVDDVGCYWYSMFVSYSDPVDKQVMRDQRIKVNPPPDYRPVINKSNEWHFNPEEQKSLTYTGMGTDINIHDQWAVESPGPIADRTAEHLGKADIGILKYRELLGKAMEALQAGKESFRVRPDQIDRVHGPVAIDEIAPRKEWQACWKQRDRKRREASGWAADPWS